MPRPTLLAMQHSSSLPIVARRTAHFWLSGLAMVFGFIASTSASDLVGVYAFIDKVVLEPSDAAPERIQLWGGFALAAGGGEKYAPAQRGYLYFKLPAGKEKAALREWNDLKTLAGKEQLVAFGSRYGAKATVRKADVKPENPDPYTIEIGLTKVTPRETYPPHKDLIVLRRAQEKPAAP